MHIQVRGIINQFFCQCRFAEQLGAKIETVYGEDIPFQIAEFARLSGASKIVIGRSSATKRHLLSKTTLTEKLIDYAPNLPVAIAGLYQITLWYGKQIVPPVLLDF